jgi:uncharacterized repeat protein (TIGR01451 family)
MKNPSQHTACTTVDRSPSSGTCPAWQTGVRGLRVWALLLAGLLVLAGTRIATAKSLYVVAETEFQQLQVRVHAYDIAPDGKLTFQAQGHVPLYGARALAVALDSDSRHLFLTYLTSNVITVVDAVTLENAGATRVEGARNLTAVVYDHGKGLLYCVDDMTPNLYIYRWNPARHELTPAPGSPLRLEAAKPVAIALDEITGELYVCDSSTAIGIYSTLDWRLLRTISVSRPAACLAVDPIRGYLYYGGADLGNFFLGRYDPATGAETETQIGSRVGVLGLAVDRITGFVFASTGAANCPDCGDDVCVFDGNLVEIDVVRKVGEPTGLAVSDGRTAFNPLRLTKTIKAPGGGDTSGLDVSEAVVGEEVTYSICFDHNDLPLTELVIVDKLPAELAFVRATGDGLYGRYDPQAHTYTWMDPPLTRGLTTCLDLVARLDPNTPVHQLVTNSVTIDSNETPPTTAEAYVVAVGPPVYPPLHVSKAVVAGAIGGDTTPLSTRPGDELTYRITFDSKGNEQPVENVRLTDTVPPETEFVRATGDGRFGRYEPLTRTYTWSYPRLAPGESNSVDLVVRVDPKAEIGATIHNTALLVSDNTTAVQASVDVTVGSFAPLQLQKTLVRGAVGQPDEQGRWYVDAGSTLTYAIHFSNPAANKTVTDISIVDTLPREVSFVSADGSRDLGFYDQNTHTYSWHYASLGPGLEQTLNLTVRVNDQVAPDTVISNSVAIAARQTTTTRTHSDVVVRTVRTDLPLRLQKTLVQGLTGSTTEPYVFPGATITYAIYFSNPATNETATQISLVDTLPREVTFVSADSDREFGSYDPGTHTYTWRYALLAPGEEKVVNLTVQVNEKAVPGTVIANAVTIRPSEMPPTTTRLELPVGPAMSVQSQMYIKPDHIYRNYPKAQADLMVVVHLPEGIGGGAISNAALVLTPGNIKATGQQIFGTSTQGKVLCFFDVDALLAATTGYGEFPLKVTGQLRDGRSFVAETTIWILKFGGP